MRFRWRARRWRPVVIGAASLAAGGILIAVLAILLTTSGTISVFESRERDSASRLYGRSLPIRPGELLSVHDLITRLDRLGYRRLRTQVAGAGTYVATANVVDVGVRPFRDADGDHSPHMVHVSFGRNRVQRVEIDGQRSGHGDTAALIEPETIAVFQGPNLEIREMVEVTDCPKHLIDAILAAEDRRYFLHPGLDPGGMARALWADLTSRSIVQGGSTLTQQLAKNLYYTGERTWSRKAGEAVRAIVLEARYSKERILRAYINEIYLGQRGAFSIRGMAAASRHYFGKSVSDLTVPESALLAGMIRAPGVYNPFLHKDRARERRDFILRSMQEMGALTDAQRREAEAAPVKVKKPSSASSVARAAYVADLVRRDVATRRGSDVAGQGVQVFSTIDPVYQETAEAAVTQGLRQLEKTYSSVRRRGRSLQAALVSVDLKTGNVLAMVGGRDFTSSQFNRATSARRQPGSLFKPVVYLAGLTHPGAPGSSRGVVMRSPPGDGDIRLVARGDEEQKPKKKRRWWWFHRRDREEEEEQKKEEEQPQEEVTPPEEPLQDQPQEETDLDEVPAVPSLPLTAATILRDEPFEVQAGRDTWTPHNDDEEFRGPVTVQRALEESLNVPTARAATAIGLDNVVAMARTLGITSPMPEVPAIALGAAEVTPFEMAGVFTTIATGGLRRPLNVLLGVAEPGKSMTMRPDAEPPNRGRPVVPREAAWVMTGLLQGVLDHGTGRRARGLGYEGVAAGKTGTSDGGRDLWFCGYTPEILTLVWVGFDDQTDTGLEGAKGALPIWVDYMEKIGADDQTPFEGMDEIAWASIDPETGGLAGSRCPSSRWAPFIPGTEPTETCREHRGFWARIFGE